MIQVTGAEGTAEHDAAVALRDLIVQTWPQVTGDPNCHIHLIAGAKCHGQATRDIDVLLLAWFGEAYAYSPFWSFDDAHGQLRRPSSVQVHSLCTVVEVKDHSPQDVRFVGTSAQVRYHGAWHGASEQNERQVFALKNHIEYHGLHAPWITRLVWLRNVSNADLPARPHPLVGARATWELLLNIIGQVTPPRRSDGDWVISAFDNAALFRRVADLFTRVVEPTRLDRQRMERVNQRSADLAPILHDVGSKLIILRGRGGVGKTMHLLQAAKLLYDEQGARVLLLTYNKALVADIRRLLTILGIADDIDTSAIHVTVQAKLG